MILINSAGVIPWGDNITWTKVVSHSVEVGIKNSGACGGKGDEGLGQNEERENG